VRVMPLCTRGPWFLTPTAGRQLRIDSPDSIAEAELLGEAASDTERILTDAIT
jgi:hypothetical protein